MSDKIDFKTKAIKKDKRGHYITIKVSIQEEDFTLGNIYAPNIGAPKYIKQILTDIKGEIDGNTIIVGEVNTPLTSMDRSSSHPLLPVFPLLCQLSRTLNPVISRHNILLPPGENS